MHDALDLNIYLYATDGGLATVVGMRNGPWHYKKITAKHSVEQVQNRDRIKIKEIERFGYTPYVIRDNGRAGALRNDAFVEEQFNLFVEAVRAR